MLIDSKVCPSCSTDLTLFAPEEADALSDDAEELKTTLLSNGDGHVSELMKVAEEDVIPTSDPQDDVFECPNCGTELPMDAVSCLKCGVEFEVEEVFECPLCKTMIDSNVDKCPSCGAEFTEEEAETTAEEEAETTAEQPETEEQAEPEKPEPETPSKPTSFTDRMKDQRDTPEKGDATDPEKPMSFADRMKAQTEEKLDTPETEMPDKPLSFAERMKSLKEGPAGDEKEAGPEKDTGERSPEKDAETPKPMPSIQKAPDVKPTTAPPSKPSIKEEYRELPKLIGEVKKLLGLAKENKMDVSKNKALIAKAVSASKKKDLANAIKMIKEGKAGLERELRSVTMGKHRTFLSAVTVSKQEGKDVSEIEQNLDDVKRSVDASDYSTANAELKRAEGLVAGLSGSDAITRVKLDVIEKTIHDAIALNVNIPEAQALFEKAKKAVDSYDNETATALSKQINDNLKKILPRYIANEMRKAKSELREIKMMNVDISKPVEILKIANNSVKDGDYGSALHAIKDFKDFLLKIKQ